MRFPCQRRLSCSPCINTTKWVPSGKRERDRESLGIHARDKCRRPNEGIWGTETAGRKIEHTQPTENMPCQFLLVIVLFWQIAFLLGWIILFLAEGKKRVVSGWVYCTNISTPPLLEHLSSKKNGLLPFVEIFRCLRGQEFGVQPIEEGSACGTALNPVKDSHFQLPSHRGCSPGVMGTHPFCTTRKRPQFLF